MRTETFSYLPPMTREELAAQVGWVLARGLVPGVEYTLRPGPQTRYWTMWGLPLFDAGSPAEVLAEADACAAAQPEAWVRLVAHDPARGGVALSFVVHRPGSGPRPEEPESPRPHPEG